MSNNYNLCARCKEEEGYKLIVIWNCGEKKYLLCYNCLHYVWDEILGVNMPRTVLNKEEQIKVSKK